MPGNLDEDGAKRTVGGEAEKGLPTEGKMKNQVVKPPPWLENQQRTRQRRMGISSGSGKSTQSPPAGHVAAAVMRSAWSCTLSLRPLLVGWFCDALLAPLIMTDVDHDLLDWLKKPPTVAVMADAQVP